MKHSNFLIFLPVLLLVLMLSACGAPEPAPITPPPVPTETPAPTPVPILLSSGSGEPLSLLSDTADIALPDGSYAESLAENADSFEKVISVSFPDGADFTYGQVQLLQETFPAAEIRYRVVVDGRELPADAEELDFSFLTPEQVSEAVRELGKFGSLKKLLLVPGDAVLPEDTAAETESGMLLFSALTPEDVSLLESACPGAEVVWKCSLFGQELSTQDERVEYIDVSGIKDEGLELFRRLLPCMQKLTYLKLDNCGTTSEAMAALRDEFPEVKVVWRVWFSNYGQSGDGVYCRYNALTDTEKIWATGTVRDETSGDLKYCTDVKYLDMGHNVMTNIDFINYMPKLEVAVLSITYINDLSPFANCPNLEYLELFRTNVSDLSPLANCKNLEHLYIYDETHQGIKDITPVFGLDKLKRFYCTVSESAADQKEEFIALHPDCETDFTWVFIGYTHWRTVNGVNTERYELLRQQMGYDTWDYSR